METVEAGKRIALKNILFATDFSACSNAALTYAVSIARRYGATLHAVHVRSMGPEMLVMSPDSWAAVAEAEERTERGYLEELEKRLQELPHDVMTPTGKVVNALAKIITERDIDLMVLGTHGRTGVRKLFVGSVAEEVFRRIACPVLSVGPSVSSQPNGEMQFRQILFPTDFGEESLAALPYAISLAEEDQSQLALLHVVEQPAAGIADLEDVKASLTRRLKELVPPEAESWCRAEYLLQFGRQFAPPAEPILEVAREHRADLIVLGVRPARRAASAATHLIHTTAQHIVAHAACPVLTVRA